MNISVINPLTGEIKKDSYAISNCFTSVDIVPEYLSSCVRLHNFRSHIGSSKTKSMCDVSGGGRKPHKQKGLGRARAGSTRSPLWKGGANIFGGYKSASTFAVNLSKRDRRLGFEMSIGLKNAENALFVMDDFEFNIKENKISNEFMSFISDSRVLIVFDDFVCVDFVMKMRNYANVFFVLDQFLNIHDILKYEKLVVYKSVFNRWNALREYEVN